MRFSFIFPSQSSILPFHKNIKAAYDAFCKMCLHIAIPPLTSYGSYIIVNQYYITLTGAIPLSRLYPVWAALIFNM